MTLTTQRRRADALATAAALLLAAIVVLGVVLVIRLGQGADTDGLPEGVQWRTAFSDQFDATKLDRTKWNPNRYGSPANEAPYNPDKEQGFYSEDAVTLSGGEAHLTVRSVQPWVTINSNYYGYKSGVITTKDKFEVRPGDFVSGRVHVPRGDGLWPAFWMTPADGSWPPEIDQFEFFDTGKDTRPYLSYLDEKGLWDGPTAYGDPGTDYVDSWHTYGLYWREDGVVIPYLDGVARPEAQKKIDTSKPMFIILNLAVQKDRTPPAEAQMDVDWVKVFRPES